MIIKLIIYIYGSITNLGYEAYKDNSFHTIIRIDSLSSKL